MSSIPVLSNPIELFNRWYAEAGNCGLLEPTVMCLSTCVGSRPSSRMVLLKSVDDRGFVFYTNLNSRKARELEENPWASLCFYWMPLGKQVRVDGSVVKVSDADADAYFATRDRQSQIGAYASLQSQGMAGPGDLEQRFKEYSAQFEGQNVPRPTHWSGFRVEPVEIEFWLAKPFRLHERLLYTRSQTGWKTSWLYP